MARPQKKYSEKEKKVIAKHYKKCKDRKEQKRLLCLKLRILKGVASKEIAEIVGFSVSFIDQIISKYNNCGLGGIRSKKQTGNRRNFSVEQEEELLAAFMKEAEAGKIVEVKEIIKAYEKLIGRPVANSVVYKMLKRHGWRKIMPRSQHPKKASIEKIDAYRKND